MSMLSAQADKLRNLADEILALKRSNADWLWKDSVKLVDAVDAMREAADTIESLRDRLQAAEVLPLRGACEGGRMTEIELRKRYPNSRSEDIIDAYFRGYEAGKAIAGELERCANVAYREGYTDGYRDGHTDAENGHDERVRASLA